MPIMSLFPSRRLCSVENNENQSILPAWHGDGGGGVRSLRKKLMNRMKMTINRSVRKEKYTSFLIGEDLRKIDFPAKLTHTQAIKNLMEEWMEEMGPLDVKCSGLYEMDWVSEETFRRILKQAEEETLH